MKKRYLFVILIIVIDQVAGLEWSYGVISAVSNSSTKKNDNDLLCIVYEPNFNHLPKDEKHATAYPLLDLRHSDLCTGDLGPNVTGSDLSGHVVSATVPDNCTVCEMAKTAHFYQAAALLVLQQKGENHYECDNETIYYNTINMTVARMLESHFKDIKSTGPLVKMYSPEAHRWDYTLLVIWLLAMTTLIVGAYWGGVVIHQQRQSVEEGGGGGAQDSLEISPLAILFLVAMMVTMLLLLYFFYDYVVYVVIAMFVLASSMSLYSCLLPLIDLLGCFGDCRLPASRIPLLKRRPRVKCIVLAVLCCAVAITWAVLRNAPGAWVLQDVLGMTFCVQLMKTIRMPSLKACSILLWLLFIYDIFFVFITPLFLKGGDSIMVRVATGGNSSSGEMLPMVLKVPHLSASDRVCSAMPFSLLGFGDILVPGLLVTYCHGFDLQVGRRRIYYIASVIAYGLGMVLTFVALALMDRGQPALLYLVPSTLLTTYALAAARGHLKHMWHGSLDKNKNRQASSMEEANSSNSRSRSEEGAVPNAESTNENSANTGANQRAVNDHVTDTSDEEASLLNQRN